ncbi:DDB1- and CUL4-associated factor 13 [Bombyx mandarina]|uniref:DDB1- and CUL4-associated factor 13 n=2 Tax=Bombyx TaxID=7090 RepID=A0A8R2APD3_BOMMO|nr:DDB1- and CUL4-associated factor 13 [Bombyx mori]XP_028034443.1 DDB1- and CUL4-associated factor 13 [Bombyx mandarina]
MSNVKIKVISRNPEDYLRATKRDIQKIPRNYDPSLHPLEAPREYVRALNAVKLERVFAKPFIGCLDGHRDGVSTMAKHPSQLAVLASGAFDGEVRIWDLTVRKCTRNFVAHEGWVRALCYNPDGKHFMSVGDDKTIKTWKAEAVTEEDEEPTNTLLSMSVVSGITHHRNKPIFATCGEQCQLWENTRNEPIKVFKWGVDSLHHVSFNQVEYNLLASCASDRSIILYDCRESGPLRKVVLELRSNALSWNPMEAFIFTVANEDYNLYTFDVRRLKEPVAIHMDHTSAVIDVDYAPTGREFVAGSYDKTIRIFQNDKGHSRDVYHTKRMQRLTCVKWSLDNKYVMSGSDEMNIRMWKARASEKLGVLKPRERQALNYAEALKEKFATHPQVKRIARHRHVPKHILNAQKELRTIREKTKRKEANRRAHSKKGTIPVVSEKKRHVVKEDE